MRTLFVLKQICFLILMSFVSNLVLPSFQVAFAGGEGNGKNLALSQIIQNHKNKKITAEQISEEAAKLRAEYLKLSEEDLIAVLPESAERVLSFFSTADSLLQSPQDSLFRSSETETQWQVAERNEAKEKVNVQLQGAAQGIPKTEPPKLVKAKFKAGLAMLVTFFAFASAFYLHRQQSFEDKSHGMTQLHYAISAGTTESRIRGESNVIEELIKMRENRSFFEETLQEGFYAGPPRSATEIETIWENLPTREMFEGKDDGIKWAEGANPLLQTSIKYELEAKYKAEAYLGQAKTAHDIKLLSGLASLVFAASFLGLFTSDRERKQDYKKQKLKEPLYEKYFWSVLRVRFPDVPTDHNAAVEWLAAKVESVKASLDGAGELSSLALGGSSSHRIAVEVTQPCKAPMMPGEFAATHVDRDAKANQEAEADAEALETSAGPRATQVKIE